MQIIAKDITEVPSGFILHQVNTRGVMGGGLARQLRMKFPGCFTPYKELCDKTDKSFKFCLLGKEQTVRVTNDLWVVNLFGQLDTSTSQRETEYHALHSALLAFVETLRSFPETTPVYIPHGLGCGLGGGNWSIVEKIIEDAFKLVNNPISICQKP